MLEVSRFCSNALNSMKELFDDSDYMSKEKHKEVQCELHRIRDVHFNPYTIQKVNVIIPQLVSEEYESAYKHCLKLRRGDNSFIISTLFHEIFSSSFYNNRNTEVIQLKMAKHLLEVGANINYANRIDNNHATSLQFATALGDIEAAAFLLEFGAKKIKGEVAVRNYKDVSVRTFNAAKKVYIEKYKKILFIFAFAQNGSALKFLPKELVAKIVCTLDVPKFILSDKSKNT